MKQFFFARAINTGLFRLTGSVIVARVGTERCRLVSEASVLPYLMVCWGMRQARCDRCHLWAVMISCSGPSRVPHKHRVRLV